MQKFSAVEATGALRSAEMMTMQRWVRRYLCGLCPAQQVENNREFAPGQKVDKAMVVAKDRNAHVCPFIELSLNADLFWIEESSLSTEADVLALLLGQIAQFKSEIPSYDPLAANAPAQAPATYKTYFTFFPHVRDIGGDTNPSILTIHRALKPQFMDNGMMVGESFYSYKSHSIYNPTGNFHSLSSPYPALAMRYMVWHDRIFSGQWLAKYQGFFP